jgi:segregation and condensation protein B
MELQKLKNILEAVLLAADKPLDVKFFQTLFEADIDRPGADEIHQALESLSRDYQGRGIRLNEVASGYRMQVVEDYALWVSRLWEEKPQRYSRALLETLVLIAYRQPITRGEIEEIRGVSVSTQITKTLMERDWIRVLGHKDVPGKPAMYGTTRSFLDYFNLKTLDELPPLSEIKDLDKIYPELALEALPEEGQSQANMDSALSANDSNLMVESITDGALSVEDTDLKDGAETDSALSANEFPSSADTGSDATVQSEQA